MNTKKLYIFLVVSMTLILSSCVKKNYNTDAPEFSVALDPQGKTLSTDDVMDIVEWVELKEDSSSFVGNVKKIEKFNSEYYILENRIQNCVMRYSSDGTLIGRIGKTGGGPGEYGSIRDFTIDRTNKKVIILSDESAVSIYTLDGVFEEKTKLSDELISRISCNSAGMMATAGYSAAKKDSENFLLMEYDDAMRKTDEWIPYRNALETPYNPIIENALVSQDGHTYYFDYVKNRILDYDCDTEELRTLLSFKLSNPMPAENYMDLMAFMSEQGKYNWLKDFIVSDSKMIVGYVCDTHYSVSVLNENGDVLMAGIFDGPMPIGFPDSEGYVYSPITVDLYYDYWEHKEGIVKPKFPISDDSNMLLMKWSIKDK